MDKLERHINLIALLLNTERFISAAEIRRKIPGYAGQSDETFHRMFERDKSELRELGLTLEQDENVDVEHGYRISRSEALLEDPGIEPDEMAALSLAAQAWRGEGSLGVMKLTLGAEASDPGPAGWVLPRVTVDRDIAALMDAVTRRKRVRFSYRTGGGGEAQAREVEPYGLYHRGDWYLTGFDRDRDAVRRFKLSRVTGAVRVAAGKEPDFEPPAEGTSLIPHGPWEGEEIALVARIAFAPSSAWWVERRTRSQRTSVRDDGWVELTMPCADLHPFAGWLAGFGDNCVVIEPPELRDAIVAHLRAAGES